MGGFTRLERITIPAMPLQSRDGQLQVRRAVIGAKDAAKTRELGKVEMLCQPER
jgi:hypothetical protein